MSFGGKSATKDFFYLFNLSAIGAKTKGTPKLGLLLINHNMRLFKENGLKGIIHFN